MTYSKFFNCENLDVFNASLEAGLIDDLSLVFISSTKQIWTHGVTYSCPYSAEEITELFNTNTTELNTKIEGLKAVATTSANGLMSAADKAKLDSLEKITVDSALSSTSTNPIRNNVVTTALEGKSDSDHTHNYAGSSSAGGAANSVKSSMTIRVNSGSTEGTNKYTFDGSAAKNLDIKAGTNVTLTAGSGTLTIAAKDTTYEEATTSAAGLMSAADKAALEGLITTGGEVNQNAFSNVKVGTTTIAADSKTDILELAAGTNVTITPDATNDKVTISAKDTTYTAGTGMSLSGTEFSLGASGVTAGTYGPSANVEGSNNATMSVPEVTVDSYGRVTSITNRTYTAKNTTYSTMTASQATTGTETTGKLISAKVLNDKIDEKLPTAATTSAAGLMSAEDKAKLDGIAEGANNYSHPTYTARTGKPTAAATPGFGGSFTVSQVTSDGTGHVTGMTDRTVTIPSTTATTDAAGLMSADDKAKLDGIEAGAQVNTVTGVKGSSESTYRTGNINITKANIGLGNVTNESKATMFTNAALTGTPTAPTAASGTNTTQIATTAFVQGEIDSKIAAADAMIYKGTIGTGGTVTALPATHKVGWTYKVITAGTYAGQACEVGDMIICLTAGTTANNAHWTVVQNNIDGAVTGPTSSTDAHVATFSGTTGKVIKDSGYTIASSVPANAKFTDTTYTAGDGVSLSGTAFSHADTSTLSGSYGPTANVTGSEGKTIVVPQITVDGYGHVTGVTNRTYTSKDTTYSEATDEAAGLMSADDKAKLDGIADNANNYSHPTYTAKTSGLYKVTVDGTGHVSATAAVAKSDITALGIPASDTNTTYTFTGGTNKFTVTPSDGDAVDVTVTPSITNNVTYSGTLTSGQVAVLDGTAGKIKASGYTIATSVPSGAKFTDTDTKVTSAANHYDPAADSTAALSVDASSTTAATWGSTSLVTGVNLQRDAKGHVTGVTVDSIKMPANPNSNTTYTFASGTGGFTVTPSGGSAQTVSIGKPSTAGTADKVANSLTLKIKSGTTEGTNLYTFNGSAAKTLDIKAGSNISLTAASGSVTIAATDTTYTAGAGLSLTSGAFAHSNSVTAKTAYGSTATTASANGGTIKVTDVKYDAQGHITASTDRTITLSQDHTKTSVTAGTAGTSTATSGASLAVPYVTVNADGHVTGYGTHTHTISGFLTAETYKGTVTSVTLTQGTGITVSDSGTAITATGSRTITLNKATTSTIGGMKASNALTTAVTLTSANGSTASRYYGVQVDKDGLAFVNIPWVNDDTTYTAGTGLTLTGTEFSLSTSGVTAGSYGPTADVTGTDGTTITVPQITVDAYGRVTGVTNRTYTSKDSNTTYSSLAAASGGTDVSLVTTGEKATWNAKGSGTVTSVTLTSGTGITVSNSGTAITGSGSRTISLASGVVTAGSKGPTAAVTGSHNATVAIPRITVDTYGRVTALSSYNLTCQNTTYSAATTSAAGLMPAADRSLCSFLSSVTTSTTLTSLNVAYSTIYVTLSSAKTLSLSGSLAAGRSITAICYPSASFTQPIPNSGYWTSMDGDSLSVTSGKFFEINIYCYKTSYYSVSCKTAK